MKKSPQFIYTSRMGSYYHLTPLNQQSLQLDTALLSVGDFVHMQNTIAKLNENNLTFKKYLNQPDTLHYLTSIDSYKIKCVEGTALQDSIKLHQKEGIKTFTNIQYNTIAKLIQPEIMVSLTELPDMAAGSKSLKRSVKKSAYFLEHSLKELKDTNIRIFGALQGGIQTDIRNMAAAAMKFAVDYPNFLGFVLYGFNQADPWVDKENAIEAVFEVYSGLDLEYILAGKGEILQILWGMTWGMDGFEIEEPFTAAQHLRAIRLPNLDASVEELDQYQNDRVNYFEFEDKKIDQLQFPLALDIENNISIDQQCQCFTCTEHTKLYLSHLVECKEMNAQVLLTIHNVYTYQRFQKQLNDMQNKQKLNQWIRWFLNKL